MSWHQPPPPPLDHAGTTGRDPVPVYEYPPSRERLCGKLVHCYGCGVERPDTRGYWSRSGRLFLCGPRCPGTREGKDESVFKYFRAWVRKEAPAH